MNYRIQAIVIIGFTPFVVVMDLPEFCVMYLNFIYRVFLISKSRIIVMQSTIMTNVKHIRVIDTVP